MKKTIALLLSCIMLLSLASCGGSKQPAEPSTEAEQPAEFSDVVYGTYATVGMIPVEDIVLNENGSYDYGEQKGTYKHDASVNTVMLQPKDGTASELVGIDGYYHTSIGMSSDDEYGLAPSFGADGKTNQTFTVSKENDRISSMKLSLKSDGTYEFSYSIPSSVSYKLIDTVAFEGNYHVEESLLTLVYGENSFLMSVDDKAIYPVVYQKKTTDNSDMIDKVQTAAQTHESEVMSHSWWSKADEDTVSAVKAALSGNWSIKDNYSELLLSFTDESVSIKDSYFGKTTINSSGTYKILKGAVIVRYEYYASGSGYMVQMTEALPYSFVDGNLNLYGRRDVLNDEEIFDATADLCASSEKQYVKEN